MTTRPIIGKDGTYTEHYKRMCWGKVWYRNKVAAVEAALSAGGWDKTHRKIFRAYPCEYCSGWHLTSNKPDITGASLKKAKNEPCPTGRKRFFDRGAANGAALQISSSYETCEQCKDYHVSGWESRKRINHKRKYQSESAAIQAIESLKIKRANPIYCQNCKYWHIAKE